MLSLLEKDLTWGSHARHLVSGNREVQASLLSIRLESIRTAQSVGPECFVAVCAWKWTAASVNSKEAPDLAELETKMESTEVKFNEAITKKNIYSHLAHALLQYHLFFKHFW